MGWERSRLRLGRGGDGVAGPNALHEPDHGTWTQTQSQSRLAAAVQETPQGLIPRVGITGASGRVYCISRNQEALGGLIATCYVAIAYTPFFIHLMPTAVCQWRIHTNGALVFWRYPDSAHFCNPCVRANTVAVEIRERPLVAAHVAGLLACAVDGNATVAYRL